MQRSRKRFWAVFGLVVVVLAVCLWRFGANRTSSPRQPVAAVDSASGPANDAGPFGYLTPAPPLLSTGLTNQATNSHNLPLLAYRLTNTAKPLKELMYRDTAILLRNALFDAAEGAPLEIPAHLKAEGDPGSYVVQARGPIDAAFLAQLKAAGAAVISYIPNNAYLVRASAEVMNQLAAAPQVQAILAWEPYFKLDLSLLPGAIKQEPLPEKDQLNVVVFPGQRDAGIEAIQSLGGHIIGEDRSPFGHQIFIQPRPDSVVELAQLPIVQTIEPHRSRVLANDLSRVRVSVATNTLPPTPNYLGLSGSNIVVNINDTGVEENHPDLKGRVFGDIFDFVGHGTHVGGTIASSGLNSPPKAPGSTNGATFRGIAYNAKLHAKGFDLLTGPAADTDLQSQVAISNIFISNNSWGYPLAEYNQSAASFDAAVRDSLPDLAGDTPVVYVFAAGNTRNPDLDGRGSTPDQIASPGTAKNVITVGAIENLRELTNRFQIGGNTNAYFFRETDTDNQVAFYSARGNVGVGLEGESGRFKPDIVAPGSWLVSCRSSQWKDPTNLVFIDNTRIVDQFIERRSTNFYFITLPENNIALIVRMLRNFESPTTFPNAPLIQIHTNLNAPPVVGPGNYAGDNRFIAPNPGFGQFWFALVNTNRTGVHFDLLTTVITTNDLGDYFKELQMLNTNLAPYYRFESGTSMSAGVVSGTLALMQEFFDTKFGRTNSPALMKALLINGARSMPCIGCGYDLQVRKPINNQGWGSIRLTNSIPRAVDQGSGTELTWPIIMVEQDPDNALATGEAHTYNVQVSTRATFEPLMVTLVWTDPPGNPAASLKLVNDLDLIVTNLDTGDYFVGNNIPQGSDFNEPVFNGDTDEPPYDVVNNVENVFINDRLSRNYSVTVRARRVNVNAFSAHTNGIRQDYALVIASANSALTNTFTGTTIPNIANPSKGGDPSPFVNNLSNKTALLNQRVGANSPQMDIGTNNVPSPSHGNTNQWTFYVFKNTNTCQTYLAIFTFVPPELSLPRFREADIDVYVTGDSNLLHLDPAAIANASKGIGRGGTELVLLTNVPPDSFVYVGVKSEDQQAATYNIFAVAQCTPFGQRDENGNIPLDFFSVGDGCVPDGSPEIPGGTRFFAVVADPANVRRVVLTNTIDHDLGGDLLGSFTAFGASPLGQPTAVLNNHRQFSGVQTFIYDDSGEEDIVDSRTTDGPGSLRDFEGRPSAGLWQFTMVDNSPFHTGCVTQIRGVIEPQDDTNFMGNGVILTIGPNRWRYTGVDVPVGVTNLIVSIQHEPNPQFPQSGPLDVYIRRGQRPNFTDYDKKGRVDFPGGTVEHGRYDFPSLQSGRYHIGIHNPNAFGQRFRLRIELQYSLQPLETFVYISTNAPTIIPDDVTTNFFIAVTNARTVADVKVGVRVDHDRLSDLVLHLVSPEGTRILLTENRGLLSATNYGFGVPKDFIVPIVSAGDNNEFRTNINTLNRQGIIRVTYNFLNVPDFLRVYYEGKRIFDSGLVNGTGVFTIPYGPGIATDVEIVMNEGGQAPGTAWNMTVAVTGPWNYAVFTDKPMGPPIKFAFPPFWREPTNIVVFSNSFEGVDPGIYVTNTPPTIFADWTVRSNWVGVFTDTNVASTGSNYLALSHGIISRGLTNLEPGHEYIFNFAHRKISSSPTQNVHVPVPTDDTPFEAVLTNAPPGADDPVEVPKLRLCPGQDVVVISTNEVDFGGLMYTAQGDTNTIVNGFPKYGLIGCWSSHPSELNPRTQASAVFYIGGGVTNGVVIAAPTEPGDYYLFLGVNDDDYGGNNGTYEVDLRWAHCQLTSGEYFIGNTVTRYDGVMRTNWAGESLFMLANPTTTNLAFRPDLNTTLLLDSIIIDEIIPSAHYLSEEPLAPLRGQTAYGEWKLEVRDNRVGPIIQGTNDPTLLSWSLNFVFEDGPNPMPIINRVPRTGTIRGDQIHYFVVNVPPEVNTNWAVVTTTGGPGPAGVELLYSPYGLPEGTMPPDPILPTGDGFILGLSTNYPVPAPIVPGRQYFLAVRNVDPGAINDYTLEVVFENVPVAPLTVGLTALGANLPPLPSWLQALNDSSVAVANMHFYSCDVPADASNILFSLTSADGRDVHLVARRALPNADHFPRPTFYDYHSTHDTSEESILITSNSVPVSLAPGRWYLGVYNLGNTPAAYSLNAAASPNPLYNIIELPLGTNDFVVTNFSLSSSMLTTFYHFVTTNSNAAVLFEIFNLTNDVDLIVRRADFPSRDLHDFSYLSTGGGPLNRGYEPIPLRTNIFIPSLGPWHAAPSLGDRGTNWYVSLLNRGGVTAEGSLCVKVFTSLNPLIGCVFNSYFGPAVAGNVSVCWDSVSGNTYDIESSINLIDWVPVPGATNIAGTGGQQCAGTIAVGAQGFFRVRAY